MSALTLSRRAGQRLRGSFRGLDEQQPITAVTTRKSTCVLRRRRVKDWSVALVKSGRCRSLFALARRAAR